MSSSLHYQYDQQLGFVTLVCACAAKMQSPVSSFAKLMRSALTLLIRCSKTCNHVTALESMRRKLSESCFS